MQARTRRVFILHAITGTAVLATGSPALAQDSTVEVKETDAYPKSMGFKLKTADVDKAKFPRHDVAQKCSECQLFSRAKPTDPLGTCSFFKRLVPEGGWCRNFKQVKKPGT